MEIQSISENWKIRPTNDSRLSANLEVVARRLFAKGSFPIEKATKLENLAFRGGRSSKNPKSPKLKKVQTPLEGGGEVITTLD